MPQLLITLLGEGPTDDALLPIIEWALENPILGLLPDVELLSRFVGPDQTPGAYGLVGRIVESTRDLPCHLLFIQHDADGPAPGPWSEAIKEAVREARQLANDLPPTVPVVPVREMEAWLLTEEMAIREAAGNPRGTDELHLPRIHEIESCLDPKAALRDALRNARDISARRHRQPVRPRDVAELMEGFAALRQLPAFQAFEADVRRVIQEQGWPERL